MMAISSVQEKTALHRVLALFHDNPENSICSPSFRGTKLYNDLHNASSMADVLAIDDLHQAHKINIISATLQNCWQDKLFGLPKDLKDGYIKNHIYTLSDPWQSDFFAVFKNDLENRNFKTYLTYEQVGIVDTVLKPSYSRLKEYFGKYENQSLIDGISFTAEHFKQFLPALLLDDDNGYNSKKGDLITLLEHSSFFKFSNQIEDLDHLFQKYVMDKDVAYGTFPEVLLLNSYKFTDDQHRKAIELGSAWFAPGSLTLFAACPHTKHLVTKKDFAEEFRMNTLMKLYAVVEVTARQEGHNQEQLDELVEYYKTHEINPKYYEAYKNDLDYYEQYKTDLTEAYQELFNDQYHHENLS